MKNILIAAFLVSTLALTGCAGVQTKGKTAATPTGPVMYFGPTKVISGKTFIRDTSYGDNKSGKIETGSGKIYEINDAEALQTLVKADPTHALNLYGFTAEGGKATIRKSLQKKIMGRIKAFDGTTVTAEISTPEGEKDIKLGLTSPYDTKIHSGRLFAPEKDAQKQKQVADANKKALEQRLAGPGAKDPVLITTSGFTIIEELAWQTEANLEAAKAAAKAKVAQLEKERQEAKEKSEQAGRDRAEAEAAEAAAKAEEMESKGWDKPANSRAIRP